MTESWLIQAHRFSPPPPPSPPLSFTHHTSAWRRMEKRLCSRCGRDEQGTQRHRTQHLRRIARPSQEQRRPAPQSRHEDSPYRQPGQQPHRVRRGLWPRHTHVWPWLQDTMIGIAEHAAIDWGRERHTHARPGRRTPFSELATGSARFLPRAMYWVHARKPAAAGSLTLAMVCIFAH